MSIFANSNSSDSEVSAIMSSSIRNSEAVERNTQQSRMNVNSALMKGAMS